VSVTERNGCLTHRIYHLTSPRGLTAHNCCQHNNFEYVNTLSFLKKYTLWGIKNMAANFCQ